MNRNEFIEAVGRYWDVAYEEGRAGRTHDTQGGIAQVTWMRVIGVYDALASRLAEAVAALHGIAHADTEASALRLRFMAADALIAMDTSKGRAQSAREPRYNDRRTAADRAVRAANPTTTVSAGQEGKP